ncbi:MAG: hypothetical protein QM576_03800 [Rhodopseudomonas sp.]|uniref:hypothetical protein n=1 Tax=Rhodopseudomonas sp. TaxID=1078 RepID=UPI0039E328CC
MTQLPLFDERVKTTPRSPDVSYIRRSLGRLLRLAREAEILPWSEAETASWEKLFPQLAASLPADEGEALIAEFQGELARLRSPAD